MKHGRQWFIKCKCGRWRWRWRFIVVKDIADRWWISHDSWFNHLFCWKNAPKPLQMILSGHHSPGYPATKPYWIRIFVRNSNIKRQSWYQHHGWCLQLWKHPHVPAIVEQLGWSSLGSSGQHGAALCVLDWRSRRVSWLIHYSRCFSKYHVGIIHLGEW